MRELDGIRSWLTRVNTLLDMIIAAYNNIDDLSVRKHFALADENKKLWAKLDTQFKQEQRQLNIMLADMLRWTACADIHSITMLTTDIKVRVQQAYEAFYRWRSILAMIETAEGLNQFCESEKLTHEEAMKKAQGLFQEYETIVANLWKLVPLESEFMTL